MVTAPPCACRPGPDPRRIAGPVHRSYPCGGVEFVHDRPHRPQRTSPPRYPALPWCDAHLYVGGLKVDDLRGALSSGRPRNPGRALDIVRCRLQPTDDLVVISGAASPRGCSPSRTIIATAPEPAFAEQLPHALHRSNDGAAMGSISARDALFSTCSSDGTCDAQDDGDRHHPRMIGAWKARVDHAATAALKQGNGSVIGSPSVLMPSAMKVKAPRQSWTFVLHLVADEWMQDPIESALPCARCFIAVASGDFKVHRPPAAAHPR